MINQPLSSRYLENAVLQFANLPGVGNKTALRHVLHLLKQSPDEIIRFGDILKDLATNIQYCSVCKNISDTEICGICSNEQRDHSIVCVVESIRNVISIENTELFRGVYHVLGGLISPVEGIGPKDLEIQSLEDRIKGNTIKEVVLVTSTTVEGDTTNFYIYKILRNYNVLLTTIARGVGFGDELEYTDEITLGKSIVNRMSFEKVLNR